MAASPEPTGASPRATEPSPEPTGASPRATEPSPEPTGASPRATEPSPEPTGASRLPTAGSPATPPSAEGGHDPGGQTPDAISRGLGVAACLLVACGRASSRP